MLASYNGEQYLEQQVASIQRNDRYSHLVNRLIIVDDGSTDRTIAIATKLKDTDPKIEIHQNRANSLGAKNNFNRGLLLSTAPFVMLSDQDDFWYQDKIISSYLAIEHQNPQRPCLVCSDVDIVDSTLSSLSQTYFSLKQFTPHWLSSFSLLAQQNMVPGCTMLVNRALLEKALPIDENAYMHDWWLVLIAKQYGELICLNKTTMAYRQHDKNVFGAGMRSPIKLLMNFKLYLQGFIKSFKLIIAQAKAFNALHGNEKNKSLQALAHLALLTKKQRLGYFYKGVITRNTLMGRLALLYALLIIPVEK